MAVFFGYIPDADGGSPLPRIWHGDHNQFRSPLLSGDVLMAIDISDLTTRKVDVLAAIFPYEPTLAMRGRTFNLGL